MSDENKVTISADILEHLYKDFADFIKIIADEDFVSFRKSKYVDFEENYKYSIYAEAKRNLGSKDWKPDLIGTGKIQEAVKSAMLARPTHSFRNVDNNLINWRKKDEFSALKKDKNLEQILFDFYKSNISPQLAFNGLSEYFEYQLIAYLFFIKDYNHFLPISQKVFDDVISEKLHIHDFKTTGRKSWDNYKTFLEIIKQTHKFLMRKDKDATLLDAHSFLWILGRQREKWLNEQPRVEQAESIITLSENSVIHEDKIFDKELSTESEEFEKRQFTPIDIIWIKNVTNKEKGQAYMDLSSDKFVLHFPTIHKTNASSPKVGEIIILRQKIDNIAYFTHLVTPSDNKLVINDERPEYRYGRNVQLIAKTPLENLIQISSTRWEGINLAPVSNGNACEINNIGGIGSIDDLRLDIWERFSDFFVGAKIESVKLTAELLYEIENKNPDLTVKEGKLKLVSHFRRERNREIVRIKKQQAIQSNTLICEVCSFSFQEMFGVNFIECHHKTPISQTGITKTNLDDLALVCPNCHQMLHTKFEGRFLSVEELRQRLKLIAEKQSPKEI